MPLVHVKSRHNLAFIIPFTKSLTALFGTLGIKKYLCSAFEPAEEAGMFLEPFGNVPILYFLAVYTVIGLQKFEKLPSSIASQGTK